MSKNFELLQQADKLFGVTERTPVAPVAEPVATEASVPVLRMLGPTQDEINKLIQRLYLLPAAEPPRVIVFAATESGNGCSWLCARLAELLAFQVTRTVCLLDCNFRRPGLHQQFGLENHYGLSESLTQNESLRQYLRPLSRPNLWLLTSGSPLENGPALLGSDRMRLRLQELRQEFDHIVVDSPALDTGNDSVALGGLSDGVVLVLKANASRRDTALKAMQEFQAASVSVRGVVLNRRTFPIPESIYKRL
jgi:Mrp family chromosome partitioning ATPase